MLVEIHPGRAAGCHDGELHALVPAKEGPQAVEDFGTLFHNGEVRGEVCVKHIVEAKVAEGGCKLAGDNGAGLHAEFLSKCHANRRGGLGYHYLFRVAEVVQEAVCVVTLRESAGGTNRHALTAVGTVGFLEHAVEGGGDGGLEAATHGTKHAHRLDLVAN